MRALTRLFRSTAWRLRSAGPRRWIEIETANGRLAVDSKDWLIGKTLYVRRSFELDQIHAVCSWLRTQGYLSGQGTILDVGANIGMIGIALLRFGYCGRVLAFEPNPATTALLAHNVQLNGLADRVRVYPVALSDHAAGSAMELSPDNSGDHRVRTGNHAGGFYGEERRATIAIPTERLDTIIEGLPQTERSAIELVWADIQGHERQFLEGGHLLGKLRVPVVSEFWPYGLARAGTTPELYLRTVQGMFQSFCVIDGDVGPTQPIGAIESLFAAYVEPRQQGSVLLLP